MRFLITGISGFVGSTFTDYILEKVPDVQVYAIRRWKSDDSNIRHFFGDYRVRFIEADLTDRGSLNKLIREAVPDYVVHFAAQSYPSSSFESPVHTLMTNGVGTLNLLDELRIAKRDGVCDPTILSVSSSEVYGMPKENEVPMTETNPIRAANPYSISKVSHDLFSQMYHSAYGLKVIITRMFSHEGKRRGKHFALSNFAYQIASHEHNFVNLTKYEPPFDIRVGNLNSVRTYAHIDDAVRAYWLALTEGKIGEVYNIGGKYTCTVGDALEDLLSKSFISRDSFRIVVDPNRIRPTDISLQIPSCEKFNRDTGWGPVKTLHDITTDLLEYWRAEIQK